MNKGDIILIPFPFTNLKGSKKRPALVLYNGVLDITVCFISTQLHWEEPNDLILKPNKTNRLKKDSLLKTSKIATIDKEFVLGKIGCLNTEEIRELNIKLSTLFKI